MYREKNETGLYGELTEDEDLWDCMSYKRLKELIAKYEVISLSQDTNSYGRFTFITLKDSEIRKYNSGNEYIRTITFYGHGLHELRGRYLNDKWPLYSNSQGNKDIKTIDKKGVLAQLEKDHKRFKKAEEKHNKYHKVSKSEFVYGMVADMTDEDFALSNLEDFESLI